MSESLKIWLHVLFSFHNANYSVKRSLFKTPRGFVHFVFFLVTSNTHLRSFNSYQKVFLLPYKWEPKKFKVRLQNLQNSLSCVFNVDLAQGSDQILFLLWHWSCVALQDKPSAATINFRWIHNILRRLGEAGSDVWALLLSLPSILFFHTFACKSFYSHKPFTFCQPKTFWYMGKITLRKKAFNSLKHWVL